MQENTDGMAGDEPVHVDSKPELEALVNDGVVLVDFYADWCGPCKMLEPTLDSLAADTDAMVVKVDVDEHQSLAAENGVQGVPTLLLYADGEQVERIVGARGEKELRELIDQYTS